jgi:hypothetical protein
VTLSYNLVFGLFLLTPGFAVFAGLYRGTQSGPIRSPALSPGSVLALALVTTGALAAHLVGALVFLIEKEWCSALLPCLTVGWEPDPYVTLLAAAQPGRTVAEPQIGLTLGTPVVLTILAYVVARAGGVWASTQSSLRTALYGWLGEVAIAATGDEVILVYVLSEVEEAGVIVGYEGGLANLTASAEHEITSVLIDSCETFFLRITPEGVVRESAPKATPIPQLYLDRTHIKNIAFERVRFA